VTGMQGDGWSRVPLGSLLTDIQPGFASGKHNSTGEGLPHLRPMNVSSEGRIDRSVLKYVEPSTGRPDQRLRDGDVLFNNTNSPELVGKTALFDQGDEPAFSNHMTRLRTDHARLEPAYLALRLHHAWREGYFAEHCNNHVSQASVGRDVLRAFPIELPPLEVQRAIAALNSSLESHSVSSRNHLAVAKQAIERFRQAVLAAACGGHLTADCRKASENAESGAALLRRASARELQGKHKMHAVEAVEPEGLPSSWAWATPSQVCDRIVDCPHSTPKYGVGDHLALDTTSMSESGIVIDRLRKVTAQTFHERNKRLVPESDDVIFAREGTVGTAVVIPDDLHVCLGQRVMLLRPSDFVLSDYLRYVLMSPQSRAQYADKLLGTTVAHINVGDVIRLGIPLPPIDEQRIIVGRVSELLQLADGLLSRIKSAGRRVERSSHAVLATAFRDLIPAGGEQEAAEATPS
jgi:type I restriction enzyme S subunit